MRAKVMEEKREPMFGRRRVIEAERNLAVKQAEAAIATQNYIAALEKIVNAGNEANAASEKTVEKAQNLIALLRDRIATLEDIIAELKDLPPEEAKEGLRAAYRGIEERKRVLAAEMAKPL